MTIHRPNGTGNLPTIVRTPYRPFDWARDCRSDVERPFPPIVGRGRGESLAVAQLRAACTSTMERAPEWAKTFGITS
jgi:hypothetical protein